MPRVKKINKINTIRIGTKIYKYSTEKELSAIAEKEVMLISELKEIIKNDRRLLYKSETGTIIPVNITKENIRGILKKKFNVERVYKKNIRDIYDNKYRTIISKKNGITARKKIENNEFVNLIFSISYYFFPQSEIILNEKEQMAITDLDFHMDEVLEGENTFDKKYCDELVSAFDEKINSNEYVRTLEIKMKGTGSEIYEEMYGNEPNSGIGLINLILYMRKKSKNIDDINEIDNDIKNGKYGRIIKDVSRDTEGWAKPFYIRVDVVSRRYEKTLNFSRDGTISKILPYQLGEWVNIEYDNEGDKEDSCGIKYIGKHFPKLFFEFKKYELKKDGKKYIPTRKFLDLCEFYDIEYEIYSIDGKLESNFSCKFSIGKIVCIIYNGHIYPVIGGKLRKTKKLVKNIVHVNDNDKFKKFIDSHYIPSRIIIAPIKCYKPKQNNMNIEIVSFTKDDKRYINNPEYEICAKFLNAIGLIDMITDNIKITSLIGIIEKNKKVPDVKSFIPNNSQFIRTPLLWKTDKKIDHKRVTVRDKNKAYTCALYSLPYLIKFDYRKNKIKKMSNKDKIIDKNLYYVHVDEWTNAIPEDGLYAGYHLKECIQFGIEFSLIEELETDIEPNYYREIIDLTKKYLDEKTFKMIWVRYIGCMESRMQESYEYKFKAIYRKEDKEYYGGYHVEFDKNHGIVFDVKETFKNVRNKFPIALQVKDFSRMTTIKEIIRLGIKNEDIVQIKTDSVAYYGEKTDDLNPTDFFGWKHEEFNELTVDNHYNKNISWIYDLGEVPVEAENRLGILEMMIKDDDSRVRKLHMQYAGSGKTTYIIEKLIPKLISRGYDKKDIIVLTPTHYTLAEYKRREINCEIMQKFTFDNTIAKEKYVIIDEIGCIETECHDMLYKLVQSGKNIECFGDFNQLQPVGESKKLNQPHYLNYLFKEINTKFTNYRNNFTKTYYDTLINSSNNSDYLQKEIKKWAVNDKKWYTADYIICYRHKTKAKWNREMLKFLGYKKWNSEGVRIVCKTNKLRELGIWNKKEFIIKKVISEGKETKYILKDKHKIEKNVEITDKQLKSNFEMAYACNVHQIQGSTINSYYWASEDDKFITGNVAYTIVSRLRQEKKYI